MAEAIITERFSEKQEAVSADRNWNRALRPIQAGG
jgi:hypothetical protein